MRKLLAIFLLIQILFHTKLLSQNCANSSTFLPTKCLEIESELVDACTNNEGLDEMVRIRIGPNPIPLNSLTNIVWTSANPWQGWASYNASNIAKMNSINSKIIAAGNCGRVFMLNPGDIIPAYAHFMIITSTLFDANAQDFSGLTDTLYVALQNNQTYTTGHFNNYGTSATRTFIIGTSTCSDTATYNRSFLVNASGNVGGGNGSTVNFTFNGIPTYVNYGCKIPQIPLSADAGIVSPYYCTGDLVPLMGNISGTNCFYWYPANRLSGHFIDSTNINTVFKINPGFSGAVKLYLKAYGNCNTQKLDSVLFIVNLPDIIINIQDLSDSVFCRKNQLNLNSSSNSNNPVTWSSNGKGSFSSINSFQITYTPSILDTGRIWFKITQTSSCGTPYDSINVWFTDPPIAIFEPSDTLVCINASAIDLNPNSDKGVFNNPYVNGNIFTIPPIAGKYRISYTISLNGCSDSMVQFIEVKPLVDASFTLSDTLICKGESIQIIPLNNGGQFYGATIVSNQFKPNTPGNYTISYVMNNGACYDSTWKQLFVEDSGDPSFSIPDTLLCEGDAPVFFNATSNNGIYFGSYVLNNSFDPISAGIYPIKYVVGTGYCADSSSHTIRVLSRPQASFQTNSLRNIVFDTVHFTYTGTPVISYDWSLGDGSNSNEKDPTHVYLKDNFYPVYLIVENALGCVDTAYLNLEIESQEYVYFPNVFTPNNDGTNDRFLISYLGIKNFHISIYNQWGQLVYESGDIDEGWDGKTDGKDCTEDAYFYIVNYANKKGTERSRHGSVSILR
ncbi:MAG: gliding motility-associated C-terminal domain-containing protein [Bacteroidia bacterium]